MVVFDLMSQPRSPHHTPTSVYVKGLCLTDVTNHRHGQSAGSRDSCNTNKNNLREVQHMG